MLNQEDVSRYKMPHSREAMTPEFTLGSELTENEALSAVDNIFRQTLEERRVTSQKDFGIETSDAIEQASPAIEMQRTAVSEADKLMFADRESQLKSTQETTKFISRMRAVAIARQSVSLGDQAHAA